MSKILALAKPLGLALLAVLIYNLVKTKTAVGANLP